MNYGDLNMCVYIDTGEKRSLYKRVMVKIKTSALFPDTPEKYPRLPVYLHKFV